MGQVIPQRENSGMKLDEVKGNLPGANSVPNLRDQVSELIIAVESMMKDIEDLKKKNNM